MADLLQSLQLQEIHSKAEMKTIIRSLCSAQLQVKKNERANAKVLVRQLSSDIKQISRKRSRLLQVADCWTPAAAAAAAAAAADGQDPAAAGEGEGDDED